MATSTPLPIHLQTLLSLLLPCSFISSCALLPLHLYTDLSPFTPLPLITRTYVRSSMEEKGRRLKSAGTAMPSSTIVCHAVSRVSHRRKNRRGVAGGRTTSVRRKVRELQRLVPGGRRLRAEQLLLRTADYIYQLRLQVHVLKTLSDMYMP